MTKLKELNELMIAVGMLSGEIHQIKKEGLGWNSLNRIVDMISDYNIYRDGFTGLSEIKNEIDHLDMDGLRALFDALLAGFEQGQK